MHFLVNLLDYKSLAKKALKKIYIKKNIKFTNNKGYKNHEIIRLVVN